MIMIEKAKGKRDTSLLQPHGVSITIRMRSIVPPSTAAIVVRMPTVNIGLMLLFPPLA